MLIYEKIIMGERLSGKEKKSYIFELLHKMWAQIKQDELQASSILSMISKMRVTIVEVDNVNNRDLYLVLNKDKRDLKQFLLKSWFL